MKKFFSFFLLIFPLLAFPQQYTIEQYLNIRGAGSPQYSPDDSKIYFTSSVTGSSQIWMVEKPGSWPFQITYFNDRVSSYRHNLVRDIILMAKDEGGSEYSQFFLLKPDGTSMEQITTAMPKVVYGFGSWFDDGLRFTYYTNERNLFYYDVHVYDIDRRESKQVYSSDHSNFPSTVSPDGKYIVITKTYSSYNNDLLLLDLETNESNIITVHDSETQPARFSSVGFAKSSEKLYVNTNSMSEFYSLYEYDISSGSFTKTRLPLTDKFTDKYDLSSAVLSNDRTKLFLNFNVDGYDNPMMYDLASENMITLPEFLRNKDLSGVRFGNISTKMLIGVNASSSPTAIYQWDYASGSVEQVTYPNLAGIDPASFVEPELIKYLSFDGLEITAFIYYPKVSSSVSNLPCIISVHGGPEAQAHYGFSSTIQYYVNAGYVVVEPNVRGSTGYGEKFASLDNLGLRENSVKDVAWLVEYLKSTGRIDPAKIAVMGGSYGGYMVLACLTLYPELFAAGIDVVGISNFVTFIQNTAEYRRRNRMGEYGNIETDIEMMKSISPVHKVNRIKAPLMIIHGKNDPRVPVGEATQMYDAIIGKGGTAELLIYDDEGHGLSKLKNRLNAYPKMVQFLDKYVKGN